MKRKIIINGIKLGTVVAIIGISFSVLTLKTVSASTNGKSSSSAITWVKSKVGKGIDYDGAYGNQCVDLIKAYYSYLGQRAVLGNGSDYTYNRLPSGWTRIKGAKPQKGDVLIYTGGYGGYGHVAIYESDYSTYHQNFNGHSYVERVTSRYNIGGSIYFWGVIRPDFTVVKSAAVSAKNVNYSVPVVNNIVQKVNNKWVYYKNGKADTSFTGVAKSTKGNWIFVKNGVYNTSFTGVAKSTNGNWVFVKNGRYNTGFTGVAKSTNGNWVFVKNGRYNTGFTGVAKTINGNWLYVRKGRYVPGYTGYAYRIDGKRVYVRNGKA